MSQTPEQFANDFILRTRGSFAARQPHELPLIDELRAELAALRRKAEAADVLAKACLGPEGAIEVLGTIEAEYEPGTVEHALAKKAGKKLRAALAAYEQGAKE